MDSAYHICVRFSYVFRMSYLAVASPTARVLAAIRAKVVPHMLARALGGADAFQFALQELGNNKDEEEESHDDDGESCSISMYHTWYCYWSTSNTLLLYYRIFILPGTVGEAVCVPISSRPYFSACIGIL